MRAPLESFDDQLRSFGPRLRDDVGLQDHRVPSAVFDDCQRLAHNDKERIRRASDVPIAERLAELEWFIALNAVLPEYIREPREDWHQGALARAFTIVSLYMVFVYMRDGFFQELRKVVPSISVTHSAVSFLVDKTPQSIRHAFAHGHWCLDVTALRVKFWNRQQFESLDQQELNFWHALSRGVAYAALKALAPPNE